MEFFSQAHFFLRSLNYSHKVCTLGFFPSSYLQNFFLTFSTESFFLPRVLPFFFPGNLFLIEAFGVLTTHAPLLVIDRPPLFFFLYFQSLVFSWRASCYVTSRLTFSRSSTSFRYGSRTGSCHFRLFNPHRSLPCVTPKAFCKHSVICFSIPDTPF